MRQISDIAKRQSTVRWGFEILATMRGLAQKHTGFLSNGCDLFWPHETLRQGYTQAGHRRFIVSHVDFINWARGLQEDRSLEATVQADAALTSRDMLRRISWQLRLAGPSAEQLPEFVLVSSDRSMIRRTVLLELNCDSFDAAKKLVMGSVRAAKEKTPVTVNM